MAYELAGGAPTSLLGGSHVTGVVSLASSHDAIRLEEGDQGNGFVSLDVPTSIGAVTLHPSELVQLALRGAPSCG
jgi:hypothetical protein